MAHHQKHQMDAQRRGSAMQSLLKMLNLSTAPTVPLGDDELNAEADEPPDDRVPPMMTLPPTKDHPYSRASAPPNPRRESLLTRAIMAEAKHDDLSPTIGASRGLSTTSSHSTASTAELTSDGDLTSRSATPSPPPPQGRFSHLLTSRKPLAPPAQVVIAPITKDDKPAVAEVGEAAVEKTLGRKRCIMFACGGTDSEKSKDNVSVSKAAPANPDPPKRKCALTFACPSRTTTGDDPVSPTTTAKTRPEAKTHRRLSPPPPSRRRSNADSLDLSGRSAETAKCSSPERHRLRVPSPTTAFHEFGSSHDETDSWVDKPINTHRKLTFDDCMSKENRIRQIGKEAEEEAEEEEREQEELENEYEDNDNEDDFAPSEDGSDGGNESDDEGGFADSDDDSNAGSEYEFWAPTTSNADSSNISHFSSRRRSNSSLESLPHAGSPPLHSMARRVTGGRMPKLSKLMRPGTPELPDSTDFVCGTLDEDRPLEAAFISCRELKKREKHIPIPQDIDPSFPTTDPDEDEDSDDDLDLPSQQSDTGHRWLKDQFNGFEEDGHGGHGRRRSPVMSPRRDQSPTPAVHAALPGKSDHRRCLHRSPPPRHMGARSPPPRKLFGHSPTRLRSPPPARLRSPRGSPTLVNIPARIGTRGLASRPTMERTASLPDTPNPFFKNFKIGSASISNIASGAVTPSTEEAPRSDLHVRGPVDIVIGLEKKRQKRKEKFWRQHARKAAREHAERKPVPGRGAERMKELGLECAERLKGYGVGQQTQLVISL